MIAKHKADDANNQEWKVWNHVQCIWYTWERQKGQNFNHQRPSNIQSPNIRKYIQTYNQRQRWKKVGEYKPPTPIPPIIPSLFQKRWHHCRLFKLTLCSLYHQLSTWEETLWKEEIADWASPPFQLPLFNASKMIYSVEI